MGNLVNDMENLSKEIIRSFKQRKLDLHGLHEEVDKLLSVFEHERLEMRADLQADLSKFVLDLEDKIRKLLHEFEKERCEAEKIWEHMEKEMGHSHRQNP